MKRQWAAILALVILFQGPGLMTTAAAEKEPADLIFDEILAMFPDLEVEAFFTLAGVDREFLSKVSFDPTKAQFYDLMNQQFQFTEREVHRLSGDGFFVRDTDWYGGFGIIYYNIYAQDLPVLVTTDSLLHAMNKSYDDILKELEGQSLHPGIARVLEATRQQVFARAATKPSEAMKVSLRDVDLYLTVALSLLNGSQEPALLADDKLVERILDDVASLRMLVPDQDPPVQLFGRPRWVDFSQFKPRGHYTDSPLLENYFRCLMWLGRADTGMNVLESPRQLRTAAVLVQALTAAKEMETLKEMDEIISFMVGSSDNLTAFGLSDLLGRLGVTALDDDAINSLSAAIASGGAGTQSIRSQMVVSMPFDTIKVAPPALFQLFGQRYILDSFVLSKVVYDDIIFKGAKQQRFMPSPLDVMAALGNLEALSLLEPALRSFNYSANLKAAQDFVASHRPEFWQQNLYNVWLDALRTLDDPIVGDNVPQAMATKAWQRKQLNTQLASWAQLRHDTILYAKQSYTASVGCVYPKGYVEPYPDFYLKLGTFATRAKTLLGSARFIDQAGRQRYGDFFASMAKTMTTLEGLAHKELAARPFSRSEEQWLQTLIRRRDGHGYGASPVYNGWYVDLFYGGAKAAIEWDPTVADVHTDPNTRQVLEVGVGRIDTLFVAIDNEADLTMYAGPTLSYHEFLQPAEKRLTDPEWREMIINGEAPAAPPWTDAFMSSGQ
jgi:hypothetical protein